MPKKSNVQLLEDTPETPPTGTVRDTRTGRKPLQKAGPMPGRIGVEEIREARETLRKYKEGKANLEQRIVENEKWWKMRHWDQIRGDRPKKEIEPASAWLFNSIANKHADAMDNFPEPSVLPREESDQQDAKQLSSILPVILEQNRYEQVYSDVWWYKLKTGTGVKGVFWDKRKNGGMGDVTITKVDLLNLFWEPGITDIQKSAHLFHVRLVDNAALETQYPWIKGKLGSSNVEVAQYIYDDAVDTSEKSAVVDWYYKVDDGERTRLHYVKFVNDELLYASENDKEYRERGFYDHGEYPFVFDTLFVEEGTPAGFGYIDVMKGSQEYIDKLGQAILKNTLMASRKRFFIRQDGSVNEEEFADWDKELIHVSGSVDDKSLRELTTAPLNGTALNVLQMKVEELKETSGNRDFSQGGTSSGVTAASAIAALQEAGSKLSRDMLKSSYRAFVEECYLVLELVRQFYNEPRCFRITGTMGASEFVTWDNANIRPQEQSAAFANETVSRIPIFDIKVRAQRSSAFSRLSQNELAKEFYGMGFFNPQLADQSLTCMEMMDFEGKDALMRRVEQNGTMFQQLQQMQQQMAQMAALMQAAGLIPAEESGAAPEGQMPADSGGGRAPASAGVSGGETLANQARMRAMNVTGVR